MKQAMNFRLSHHATATLSFLQGALDVSKTAVLEKALDFYAKKKMKQDHPLFEFYGALGDVDIDKMLKEIKSSRRSKNIKVKL